MLSRALPTAANSMDCATSKLSKAWVSLLVFIAVAAAHDGPQHDKL